ncbi:class I SAM-dependent methyltransferase [Bacillus sp. V33-4]|uniref:class I SAM-dependent methyltransferase n=1 Tax=Bacillus sp. V33-4 TaxID=2054169 RepID=UPI000C7694B1|nr:class I SAM-dependent methyltransferase [Bacillus sp. V33-4]PLR82729.1 SAM-dependent methyltransferase [Bacillus sp. V33-4]
MGSFDWTSEAEKQWDKRAGFWNSRSSEMWDHGSRKDIVPFIEKHLEPGSTVCDLGCGDGYSAIKLAKAGFTVTGVDVSAEMVETAETNANGTSAEFLKADISRLPYADSSFTAAVAINSLEWTENPLAVLCEAKRIVKSDGLAVIAILGPTAMPREHSYRRLYGEKVICNTMMPWEFEKLALENGWRKIDEFGVYKRGTEALQIKSLPLELKQSLAFMWVFMLENTK